MRKCTVDNFVF